MEVQNPYAIEQGSKFLIKLHSLKRITALEVACGGAPVTKAILSRDFREIDLMDRSERAVIDAMELKK